VWVGELPYPFLSSVTGILKENINTAFKWVDLLENGMSAVGEIKLVGN
jgi:hypothetical protein